TRGQDDRVLLARPGRRRAHVRARRDHPHRQGARGRPGARDPAAHADDLARAGLQQPDQHPEPAAARRGHGARPDAMSAERRIDWRQARALVRAYIVMSFRAMPMRAGSGERKSGGQRALILMLGIYTLLGGAMSVTAALSHDVFDYSFMLHLMTLF